MRAHTRSRAIAATTALALLLAAGSVFAGGHNAPPQANEPKSNQFWWPEQLDLSPLRQHSPESNPLGNGDFDYASGVQHA